MEYTKDELGNYIFSGNVPYGETIDGAPVPSSPKYAIVPEGEIILKGDEAFDIYAGWIKTDGYHARNGHHTRSEGRWTTWRRKIK